jgi:membrane protease YdiL (CAAX protease family)
VVQDSGELSSETQIKGAHTTQLAERIPFLALSVVVPTILIGIAEAFFFMKDLEIPLVLHGLNLMYCILAPFLLNIPYGIFQAFSLVSLLRMMNIGMPIFFDMTIYWLPFIYAPVMVVSFMIAMNGFSDGAPSLRGFIDLASKRIREANIKTIVLYITVGLVLGALLGFIEYQVLGPERLIPEITLGSLLLLGIVMFVFVGLGEELVFRYLLQDRFKTVMGTISAILLTALIFSLMHSGYSQSFYIVYVFFIGLIFGISYERTRSLLFVVVLHGSINFFLFSVFPY